MKELAAEVKEELAMSSRLPSTSGSASRAHQPDATVPNIRQHLDRELPDEEASLR
jgi:hypothetical protein